MTAARAIAAPRLRHHAWVKVKLHNYVCSKCGMQKVNVEVRPGDWIAEWHTPDGDVIRLRLAPGCAEGNETPERLAWLAEWTAANPSAVACNPH